MQTQIHVGTRPSVSRIQPISTSGFVMPHGGLWTSSYDDEIGSAWMQLGRDPGLMSLGPPLPFDAYLLHVSRTARVFCVDAYSDLEALVARYPTIEPSVGTLPALDFERIAEDYDGMHLTKKGEAETRLSSPFSLYSWECESTVWFRWVFDRVEAVDVKPSWKVDKRKPRAHGKYGEAAIQACSEAGAANRQLDLIDNLLSSLPENHGDRVFLKRRRKEEGRKLSQAFWTFRYAQVAQLAIWQAEERQARKQLSTASSK